MTDLFCPHEGVAKLASLAREVCPFPDYAPNPLFTNMLSVNSSRHLSDHYTAVQSSLNPQQLEDFTQSLRRTFGKEGRVSYGGVGVVALSLALLFDTLAKQAKGEFVSDSGPIPGLFVKHLKGFYLPQVHTISDYLRLVPHIANNPTRMRDEAEKCLRQMKAEFLSQNATDQSKFDDDITTINMFMVQLFGRELRNHFIRINGTYTDDLTVKVNLKDKVLVNFNCDPETFDENFLSEEQKSDPEIQEALRKFPINSKDPFIVQAAEAELVNSLFKLGPCVRGITEIAYQHRKDFDLKANALRKWEA